APVVGEVRRDGWIALVTLNGREPTSFVTGRYVRDTLWMEMTSVMEADEWPRGARAAFVRGDAGEPIAWFRGTVPGAIAPAAVSDSLSVMPTVPAGAETARASESAVEPPPPAARTQPTPLGTPVREARPDPPAPRAAP